MTIYMGLAFGKGGENGLYLEMGYVFGQHDEDRLGL
jgi:hypothetical protein